MEMVRYCPVCDDEFRPDILVCSDCGASLILQEEGVGAKGAASGGEPSAADGDWRTALDAVPVSQLVPARAFDSLEDMEPAIAALADIRLPSRVLVQNGRYILLVRPESLPESQGALHKAMVDADDSSDPTFDQASGRYTNCPACDTRLPEKFAGACPECGLELSGPGVEVTVPGAE
jgi:hypothetical protein